MTSYGYRLYTFEVKKERARKHAQPLVVEEKDKPTWRYQDHFAATAKKFIDRDVHGLPPKLNGDDRKQNPDHAPVFQLIRIESHGQRVVGQFRHGRPSGHGLAIPKASKRGKLKPVDISDYSPTRDYRFILWFPDAGETGMMAVEAIAGACPTRYLSQWARWWSQTASKTADETESQKPWYNFTAYALGDAIQVQQFIATSTLVEVVLVAGSSGRGRLRRNEEFRITSTLDKQGKKRALKDLQTVMKAKQSDEDLAAKLATVLGRNVDEIDLDDGWVVVDTEYGKHQVSPTRIPDVFTYPIGEEAPSDTEFRIAATAKARELSSQVNGAFDFS